MGNWSAAQQDMWRRECLRRDALAAEEMRRFNDIVTRAFKYRIANAQWDYKGHCWIWKSATHEKVYWSMFYATEA